MYGTVCILQTCQVLAALAQHLTKDKGFVDLSAEKERNPCRSSVFFTAIPTTDLNQLGHLLTIEPHHTDKITLDNKLCLIFIFKWLSIVKATLFA